MKAADLSVGSQIDYKGHKVTRTEDWVNSGNQRWEGDDGVRWGQADIDEMLQLGAQVLRVGPGPAV